MGRVHSVNMWHQVGALFQEQEQSYGTLCPLTTPRCAEHAQRTLWRVRRMIGCHSRSTTKVVAHTVWLDNTTHTNQLVLKKKQEEEEARRKPLQRQCPEVIFATQHNTRTFKTITQAHNNQVKTGSMRRAVGYIAKTGGNTSTRVLSSSINRFSASRSLTNTSISFGDHDVRETYISLPHPGASLVEYVWIGTKLPREMRVRERERRAILF